MDHGWGLTPCFNVNAHCVPDFDPDRNEAMRGRGDAKTRCTRQWHEAVRRSWVCWLGLTMQRSAGYPVAVGAGAATAEAEVAVTPGVALPAAGAWVAPRCASISARIFLRSAAIIAIKSIAVAIVTGDGGRSRVRDDVLDKVDWIPKSPVQAPAPDRR